MWKKYSRACNDGLCKVNASSGVFKLSHDLGFGKDTNLDAITKGRLFQVVIMTQNRLVRNL